MFKKEISILAFIFVVVTQLTAQNYNIYNERTFDNLFNMNADTASNFHSSFLPYSQNEFNAVTTPYDSILNELRVDNKSKFFNYFFNENLIQLINTNKNGVIEKSIINPILNTGFTYEKNNIESQSLIETSVGLNLQSNLGKKWSGQLLFLVDKSNYASYIDELVQDKNISPGYGYSENDRSFFTQGNITFTADKNFTFQAGYGKNFIGDGYRSLFLSDNANSYPYLKITANIWKLKYMALYSVYQDIRGSNGVASDYFTKYSTIHYLSFNATKWLNVGFFESIIFQAQEGQFYRGFDINYLNPVIFLRPTEYSQGSSDNALLGGSLKIKIKKKNILYGQIILDEFLLNELKSGNGWWANKYGIQVGLKMYDFLWVKNLRFQLEYNIVRPFTYSHSYKPTEISTLQNFAHFNAPLAHPLGANFNEIFTSLSYHKKRWIFEGTSTIAQIGLDTNFTTSVGQDLYRPNNDRAQDYGYETGGGLRTDILNTTLKVSYVINPKSRFTVSGGITNRAYRNNVETVSNNLFFIGLKTNIINRYTDF